MGQNYIKYISSKEKERKKEEEEEGVTMKVPSLVSNSILSRSLNCLILLPLCPSSIYSMQKKKIKITSDEEFARIQPIVNRYMILFIGCLTFHI